LSIQPPIQWVPGTLSPRVKRPGREADHSPPSSAEVMNAWRYTSTPKYVFMAWCLVKHRDNFAFIFIFTIIFYFYPYYHIRTSRSRRMRLTGHVADIVQRRSAYKILVGKP
jgi:hypothetical protein